MPIENLKIPRHFNLENAQCLVIVPCLLYFKGTIGLEAVKWTALAGTMGWFIATPMWMSRKLPVDAAEVDI